MNKEYVCISYKELLVTDENGHITKRNIENDDMYDVLLLENDLEKINEEITKLEKIIHQDEESGKLTIKGKIILAMMPFIIGMSAYCIACLISPSLSLHIIPDTIGMTLCTATIDIAFIVSTRYYPKHINGIKNELSTAYQLREELEQRLSNVKEKSKDFIATNIEDSKKANLKINEPVILEESTPFSDEAKKLMQESYTTGYVKKGPVLTKRKTPSGNTRNK